jgi:hypothetical protein
MSQSELLKRVSQKLDQLKIPYMLTGSVVSSLQGEPRSTHDIDIVISLGSADVESFIQAFPSVEYYVERTAIQQAIQTQGMFNLIDFQTGDKVDFWLLSSDPFYQSSFSRRYREQLLDSSIPVSRPEDTILSKLHWAKLCGGSEKQFHDALRIYEVQYQNLDLEYLDDWVKKLEVQSDWERIKKEAEIP